MVEKNKTHGEIAKEVYFKNSHESGDSAAWDKAAQAVLMELNVNDLLILLKEKSQRSRSVYASLGREWAVFITELEKLQAWHYCWLDERGEKP
jgi:hypothetical protein